MNQLAKSVVLLIATAMPWVAGAHYGHENWAAGDMPMMNPDEMNEHMEQMSQLMGQIQNESSPEKRQALMQEHMNLMQRYMYRMHGAMGGQA
ncbi:MAG: hypothetical protein R3175_05005 [Marinobacter sp.]|uniref:hypothetical protein n=1 Tax=Marinobacter sp. TaxID=50741 RepID=UPI00299DFA8A|nr:hypothetical protein [Marinobacter sp.]MDX1755402.1 hypothetical protein [Marinobacter sp.]